MSKCRVLEFLPFLALIAIAAMILSVTLASAGFAFPDLRGKWSFGSGAPSSRPYQLGITTTVTKAYMPVADLSAPAGFNTPFRNFNPFSSPGMPKLSYKRT
jgi:hypothetical protein